MAQSNHHRPGRPATDAKRSEPPRRPETQACP